MLVACDWFICDGIERIRYSAGWLTHRQGHFLPQLTSKLLAGPADALSPLLAALKAEKVFVREVDTLGVAYHSPALLPFAEDLRAGEGAQTDHHGKPLNACNYVPYGHIHTLSDNQTNVCSMPLYSSATVDLQTDYLSDIRVLPCNG